MGARNMQNLGEIAPNSLLCECRKMEWVSSKKKKKQQPTIPAKPNWFSEIIVTSKP